VLATVVVLRRCASRSRSLAFGGPEHEAEHTGRGSGAIGRYRLHEIAGGGRMLQ
jgi:hypothetical protein